MIVVSDTSPLRYLVLIDVVEVLPALFGQVYIPPAVLRELEQPGTPEPVRAWAASPPHWLQLREPTHIDPALDVDMGEAEAISLARELAADRLLMDDGKGRVVAIQHGLEVTGTLTVLLQAAEDGLLDLAETIGRLKLTNFRASAKLLDQILKRGRKPHDES